MAEETGRVLYPELTLIKIQRWKAGRGSLEQTFLYPEAAVKVGLSLPSIEGHMACNSRAGFCSAIRICVVSHNTEQLIEWAEKTAEVIKKDENQYVVRNWEDIPTIEVGINRAPHYNGDKSKYMARFADTVGKQALSGNNDTGPDPEAALKNLFSRLKRLGEPDSADDYQIIWL